MHDLRNFGKYVQIGENVETTARERSKYSMAIFRFARRACAKPFSSVSPATSGDPET